MKKDRICLICICMAVIALILAGCSDADPAEPETSAPEVTELTTEAVKTEKKPSKEDGYVHSFPLGSTASYDLDGDGAEESITVCATEYTDGTLTAGTASVTFAAISPTGYFTVINADQSRKGLLIGVSDYGFSDDPVTVLYAYDGTSLTEVGYFYDITGINEWEYTGAVFHGDGTFTAKRRWDVLGSWNTVGMYQVRENSIADITEFYPYIDWEGNLSAWEVEARADIIAYEKNDLDSATVTVPTGTVMKMMGLCRGAHEDAFWVAFDVEAMGELWVSVERIDWESFVHTGIGFISSEQAFDGFFYAG